MSLNRSNKKLKNNIVYSSLYQILVFIVPIITTPYVTRIFDASQMGDYSLSLSIASLFVIVSQFGIETYGTREIAKREFKKERDQLFFKLLSIQFTISVVMFIIYNIIFNIGLDVQNKGLFFTQSLLILVNIFDISWFFIGIEEVKRTIFRNAMTKVFTTLSILFFINSENQIILYALLNVIGMLIGNLTMVVSSRHYIDYNKMKYNINKKHVKGSVKLLTPRLLNSSYTSIENTILRISTTAGNVGIYSQAKKIDNLIFSVINSAINALSPRMSYYVSRNDTKNINIIFNKGLKYASMFSIIFISGIFAVSADFVNFFFGEGYEMVAPVLNVISPSLILLPIMALLNRGILIPHNKDKEYSISIIVILISGTFFNILLSPLYGSIGAAITYNLTQIFSFIYLLYIARYIIDIKNVLKNILNSIIFIIINVYIVNGISKFITIENSFLSFLVFGIISIGLNLLVFRMIILMKKLFSKGYFN